VSNQRYALNLFCRAAARSSDRGGGPEGPASGFVPTPSCSANAMRERSLVDKARISVELRQHRMLGKRRAQAASNRRLAPCMDRRIDQEAIPPVLGRPPVNPGMPGIVSRVQVSVRRL